MLKDDRHPVVNTVDAGREAPLPFMSALTPIAEVARRRWHFRFVPQAEVSLSRIDIRYVPIAVLLTY